MKKYTYTLIVVCLLAGLAALYSFKPHPVFAPVHSPQNSTSTVVASTTLSYKQARITLKNKAPFNLTIPTDYTISVAAEGLKKVRFMTFSPDDRLFAGEMGGQGDTHNGSILIFENFNTTTQKFEKITRYLDTLRNPNSVAFYTDATGATWLYVALTDKLVRYAYAAGDNAPNNAGQTIATFPDYGLPPAQGGWHLTRTVLAHNDKIYVSVGSSCNSCEEKKSESSRASVMIMDPDGKNEHVFASGLRNAVGITFVDDQLYATEMGVDHLGNDTPNDTLYRLEDGKKYGWPYCYKQNGESISDSLYNTPTNHISCAQAPAAWSYFPAHSAPLGLAYVDTSFADKRLHGSFLVALHGSGKPAIGTGYAIVKTTPNGHNENIISGFLQKGVRVSRPVALVFKNNRSFFFSDDLNGVIYYISYLGTSDLTE